jgi:hypothetical protein
VVEGEISLLMWVRFKNSASMDNYVPIAKEARIGRTTLSILQ